MIARAQIWLGTLVEIALPASDAGEARFAAAFGAIAHIHRKMSAHDRASDVARIAREAHARTIAVDTHTYAVLELALSLARETDGAFDPTVASAAMDGGDAPAQRAAAGGGFAHALILEGDNRVRTTAPIALDLGGIAKGYAVDRAIAALLESDAGGGIVNAGGDLRAFGSAGWVPVRIRHPSDPALAVHLFDVRDVAVATSADYFRTEGALLDPRTRRRRPFGASVTVAAPSCAVADALTKVVAGDSARAAETLARHGAHAFRLEPCDSGVRAATTCGASTSRLRLAA
jgi:thiamine biosynthesis lipoprotein